MRARSAPRLLILFSLSSALILVRASDKLARAIVDGCIDAKFCNRITYSGFGIYREQILYYLHPFAALLTSNIAKLFRIFAKQFENDGVQFFGGRRRGVSQKKMKNTKEKEKSE